MSCDVTEGRSGKAGSRAGKIANQKTLGYEVIK